MATAVGQYRIGEIAERLGLTERTIRYYEEVGLLESVKRVEGGRRVMVRDDAGLACDLVDCFSHRAHQWAPRLQDRI